MEQQLTEGLLVGFLIFTPLNFFLIFPNFLSDDLSIKFWILIVIKNFGKQIQKSGFQSVSVPAKFEGYTAKIVEGVEFLIVTVFSKKHYCPFSRHGWRFNEMDFKLGKMHNN